MVHTMGSLLLSLSCSGALMVILICILSYAFRKKSSFQWQYYIWLFVIARLLLPFAPEGNLMESLGEKFEAQMQYFQAGEQKAEGEGNYYKQDGAEDLQGIENAGQKGNFTDGNQNAGDGDQEGKSTGGNQNTGDGDQKGNLTDANQNVGDAGQEGKSTGGNQNAGDGDQKGNLTDANQNVGDGDQKRNLTDTNQNVGDAGQKGKSTGGNQNTEDGDQKGNLTDANQNVGDAGQEGKSTGDNQNAGDGGQKGDFTGDNLNNRDANQKGNSAANDTSSQKQNFSDTFRKWEMAAVAHIGNLLQKLEPIQKYLLILWLAVAVFLVIRKVTVYQCFVRYIRAGSTPVSDISSLEALSAAEEELGIKRALELWHNPMISSPMLIGILRPCIVLPEGTLSEKAFHYTVLHELIHYKRRDLIYKWLGQMVLCIHWLNPLVYIMAANIDRLCELSCDEAVNRHLSSDEGRREYAATLLEAMKTGGNYRERLASITLSENKKMLKERLEAIMRYEKMTTKKRLLATVLTVGVFASSLYIGSYTASAADDTTKLEAVTQASPEAVWKAAALKAGARSDTKLVEKPKANTSASSSGASEKTKANTSASSSANTSAKPKESKSARSSSTSTLKSGGKQKSDKITAAQADKMALALTKEIWVWDWIAFYVPYMSDAGVEKLIPASKQADWAGSVDFTTGKKIKFTKKKINAARKKKASGSLTRKDIDKHALLIMQSNGDWDCISAMLPYMTHSGIDAVVRCYNSKQSGDKKHAKDYY